MPWVSLGRGFSSQDFISLVYGISWQLYLIRTPEECSNNNRSLATSSTARWDQVKVPTYPFLHQHLSWQQTSICAKHQGICYLGPWQLLSLVGRAWWVSVRSGTSSNNNNNNNNNNRRRSNAATPQHQPTPKPTNQLRRTGKKRREIIDIVPV